jgi:aryl-alcohol dehydrogenase
MVSGKKGQQFLSVIQGDSVPQRFIPEMIGHHRAGRFPFDRLVKFYDFTAINQAIADVRSGKTIKAVLKMEKHLNL